MYLLKKAFTIGTAIGSVALISPVCADSPAAAQVEVAQIKASLAQPWTPPTVRKTEEVVQIKKRRPAEPITYGTPSLKLDEQFSDDALLLIGSLPETLMPIAGNSSMTETKALSKALNDYSEASAPEDVSALVEFTQAYPHSRWMPALLLNLGIISYDTGYFSKALDYWWEAWELSNELEEVNATSIANRSIAEYARMNARVGRMDEVERVIGLVSQRHFLGHSKMTIDASAEGLWTMKNRPEIAFRCGPFALKNLSEKLTPEELDRRVDFMQSVQSPLEGFSLSQVHEMASADLGLNLQMAQRAIGASVIIPSVVHWELDHYGALVRELDGKYLLKDPTFGNETWVTQEVLDTEASGYFLVPEGVLPEGWEPLEASVAGAVYGKGYTSSGGEEDTGSCDKQSGGDRCSKAMATYTFHTLAASLSISDTPVGYPAAFGPDVRVRATYNQRESGQPTTLNYTSFSPQWVSNWVSYLEDNTTSSGSDVTNYQRGGGSEVFSGFNVSTQSYGMDPETSAVLIKLTANTYKKVYPDGSEEYFEQYIGLTGTQRKVFLSKIVDSQGQEVTLEYDSVYSSRLKYIHDAAGLTTEFFYLYSGEPYLVTKVEDPYGREANFSYTDYSGIARLISIEDVYGIISSFHYDSAGNIDEMTTPYGTTEFDYNTGYSGSYRFIEATDPYGDKERVEYRNDIVDSDFLGYDQEAKPDHAEVNFTDNHLRYRNSFYWDKQQMKYAEGNYSKAQQYHWLHGGGSVTGTLESEKMPLTGRIWYNYPGQSSSAINEGDSSQPIVIARVVEDETDSLVTQAHRYEYNTQGNVSKSIDPLGRETLIEYATNGIDVLFIKQRTGGTELAPVYSTLASYTYNPADPAHRPRTFIDSAGNTTIFSYNSFGKMATVTNELSEVITFTYKTNTSHNGYGKILTITGDVPGGNTTFTYDSFDRIRSTTNSEGHTLTYDYDALDRVTVITYPDTSYEQFDYENHSLVAQRDRAGLWTRYFENALMQPILEIDPLGQVTQYEWCRCGDIRKLIDGNMNVTHWKRDVQGRVTSKEFADGTEHFYTYQPQSGKLETFTDVLNQVATRGYFIDGNLALIDYSETNTPDESFTYDPFYDRAATLVDGIGTTHFAYHPDDGVTSGAGLLARVNGPFADDTLKYTYDTLTRLNKREIVDDITFSTVSYSEGYTFDDRSRVEDIVNNLGMFDYFYVGQSNRIDSIDLPNGMETDYTYENASGDHLIKQIKHLNSAGTPSVISQFDYSYRQDRNIETWTTTQNAATPQKWTFNYDHARQLASAVRTNSSTQAVLEQLSYAYDKSGNRTSETTGSSANTNYPANQLNQTSAEQGFGITHFSGTLDEPALVTIDGQPAKVMSDGGSAPYTFTALINLAEGDNTVTIEAEDGNGNIATQSYSVNAGGITKTLEYDLNGNLRFERDSSGTVLREFKWDAKNRLMKILEGTHETEFVYDGFDRRVRIIEREDTVEQSNTVYLWDGGQIVQRRSSDGATVERSYFINGFEEGGSDYFYTKDHLGSVREVVASDGTTIEAVYDYSPWGEVSRIGGTGAESDFLYTGHFFHDDSDLHLTLYRAYNPELGMWLSRDPLEFNLGFPAEFLPEGPNLYGYVGNNPINNIDVEGEFALNAIGAGIGAGISFGTQFAGHGGLGALWNGDWDKAWEATKCVDYADVAISAGMGALGLSAGKNALQGAKALRTANQARKGRFLTNYLKEEAIDNAVNEGKNFAAKGIGALAGQELKEHLDVVPGGDCE